MAEPRSAPATAKPSSQEAAPDQSLMASTAPLMTAVSKPNKNPPMAADAATRATLPTAMPSIDDLDAARGLLSTVDMGLVGCAAATNSITASPRSNQAIPRVKK